jgi:tRNA pseudouridine38-40 synthase
LTWSTLIYLLESLHLSLFLDNSPTNTNKNSEFTPRVDENGIPLPRSERKPKKKIACMIGYCGAGYNGMQIQPNPDIKTIEGELFQAFARAGAISPENSDDIKKNGFMRCARTDKGVHAAGNVVSCKLIIEDENIVDKINAELPEQIRVWGIQRTSKSFDCRKMCSSRVYEYLLPTYTLLPPKPKTVLSNLIATKDKEHPGIIRDDLEGKQWWEETRKAVSETELTAEEIAQIESLLEDTTNSNSSIKTYNEDGSITDIGRLMKIYKATENKRRRSYNISKERLDLFREAMKQYEGSHNFHNFTLGKTFKDPSANRYMKETTVSEPFVIEGTEWVSIHIHGQSFMLHQIRKMIAMAVLVIRTGCPITRIQDCFGPTKINVPKAPALGLLLENPVYDGCNAILEKFAYEKIEFSKYTEQMAAFKLKYIYDKIYAEEVKENVYYGFFGFIDTFSSTNSNFESESSSEAKHVFDFLGGIFDSGLDESGKVKPLETTDQKNQKS